MSDESITYTVALATAYRRIYEGMTDHKETFSDVDRKLIDRAEGANVGTSFTIYFTLTEISNSQCSSKCYDGVIRGRQAIGSKQGSCTITLSKRAEQLRPAVEQAVKSFLKNRTEIGRESAGFKIYSDKPAYAGASASGSGTASGSDSAGPSGSADPSKEKKSESNATLEGFIAFLVLVLLIGGCSAMCSSNESSHRDYSTDETMEFMDNIDTPGTSEYKWYHEDYLPNRE